jgi:hypothetical protein
MIEMVLRFVGYYLFANKFVNEFDSLKWLSFIFDFDYVVCCIDIINVNIRYKSSFSFLILFISMINKIKYIERIKL